MKWLAINKSAGNMLLRILLRWGMLLLLVQWLILLLLPRLLLLWLRRHRRIVWQEWLTPTSQATHPASKHGCMNSERCPSITQLSTNRQHHLTPAGQ
jgi:hypothetical protein